MNTSAVREIDDIADNAEGRRVQNKGQWHFEFQGSAPNCKVLWADMMFHRPAVRISHSLKFRICKKDSIKGSPIGGSNITKVTLQSMSTLSGKANDQRILGSNFLDLFSNFKWVRARGCLIEPCGRVTVASGPHRVSWFGDAG